MTFQQFWRLDRFITKAKQLSNFLDIIVNLHGTEASAERSFSEMKFVKRPLRNRLKHSVVNSELFIRLNYYALMGEPKPLKKGSKELAFPTIPGM